MLKGTVFITDDLNVIYNAPIDPFHKVVSLDEDNVLSGNNIIGGTCLLPPMEAKIAEVDGNEQLYDSLYSNHLLLPFQQEFISALIAFLYKGGNLILFLPEIGYTNTKEKLTEHLFRIYGIHPGIIGNKNPQLANCFYDASCIPIWLNLIFMADVISPQEYLFEYPEDAVLATNEAVVFKLIDILKPYGRTINEKISTLSRYHHSLHRNPNIIQSIFSKD